LLHLQDVCCIRLAHKPKRYELFFSSKMTTLASSWLQPVDRVITSMLITLRSVFILILTN